MRHLEERTIPGLHARVFEMLRGHCLPPAEVLDLGAGSGAWANRLADHGYRVTAVERDSAGYRGAAPLLVADLNKAFSSLFGGRRFDLITCLEVIEHVENPRHLLREARSLLKSGGLLIVTTPNFQSVVGRLRFLWTGELRHFGRDARFNEPTHISPLHTLMFERALADSGLSVREHAYDRLKASGSRWPFRLIASMLEPVLRGSKGGDTHIFVLAVG
jgi:SAM-dependent methyltransferase